MSTIDRRTEILMDLLRDPEIEAIAAKMIYPNLINRMKKLDERITKIEDEMK